MSDFPAVCSAVGRTVLCHVLVASVSERLTSGVFLQNLFLSGTEK